MIPSRASSIERTLAKFLGRPEQALRTGDPLDVLIGTILSQNTNDRNSHRAYTNLRERFPDWNAVRTAPVKRIEDAIRTGGMAPSKARRIKALLQRLWKSRGELSLEHLRDASVDAVFDELVAHDGVGLKTAACVCLFGMGRDVCPVDTHVHRVCNRLGLVTTTTPDKTFEALQPQVPHGRAYAFHMNLIRFGRRVCKSQNPQCGACPLFEECRWQDKQQFALRHTIGGASMDFMLMDEL